MNMKFHVMLEPQPEGGFTATCVEIPGAISEGETEAEALDSVSDAIRLILSHMRENAERVARRQHGKLRTVDVDAETST